jgi:hypothetical protein
MAARAGTNGLGIAGFVCSLVGLLTCGVLSPVGLLLSLVAMFRPPRGFAIAGVMLGILGSLWVAAIIAVVSLTIGLRAAASVVLGAGDVSALFDIAMIQRAIRQHHQETGALPRTLDELSLEEGALTDSWGARYDYAIGPDGRSYTIHSPGGDGQTNTADDIRFTGAVD